MKFPITNTDKNGNKLTVNEAGQIVLKLVGKMPRHIGELVINGDEMTYYKQEKCADIFRKNNSWGLCRAVVDMLKDEEEVVIHDDAGRVFTQTKKIIIEHGQHLLFKQQGFELRILLPLEKWRMVTVDGVEAGDPDLW